MHTWGEGRGGGIGFSRCVRAEVFCLALFVSVDEKSLSLHLDRWVLDIRRRVLAQHDRSPVPGSVTLLGKHYREGMDLIHDDMRKVLRFVEPDPISAEDLGSSAVAEDN